MRRGDQRARATPTRGARLLRAVAVAAALAAAAGPVRASADLGPQPLLKVEAAYLRNFARYVSWPDAAFHAAREPWQVCVLGRDDLAELLERMLQGRAEQDRPFEVRRARSADGTRDCHIVFVGFGDPARRRAALAELGGRPVLTVGDAETFLEEGGVVQLDIRDTVQMRIDLDHARAGALRIPTKMLEVAWAVVENGVARGIR